MIKRVYLYVLLILICGQELRGQFVTKNMAPGKRYINVDEVLDYTAQIGLAHKSKRDNFGATLPPVILVPGVGGSQLIAAVNKSRDHWWCSKQDPGYRIWITLEDMIPIAVTCFLENLSLVYNSTYKKSSNSTGVDITTYAFGSTEGIEYLDPTFKSISMYYGAIVNALEWTGYQKRVNLFGAPYDWRMAPGSHQNYFGALKTLIETAFFTNNQTKVIVVAHSMGTTFTHFFFNSLPQAWKDKFINRWVPISPPWIGAVEAVQSLASGDDFSIPILSNDDARRLERTFESPFHLLPLPNYWGDAVFVVTPKKNYTAKNYNALFDDMGVDYGSEKYQLISKQYGPDSPPFIDTYCLYGYNMSTVVQLHFEKGDFDAKPKQVMGDGDGTVPTFSLQFCQNWRGKMNQTLMVKAYPNQDHVDILQDKDFVNDLLAIILP